MRTKLDQLADLGQAIRFDYIRRSFITSVDLQALIDEGLHGGCQLQPDDFRKAIVDSTDYDDAMHRLVEDGKTAEEIYEALALDDTQRTADLLRTVYR